LNPNCSSIKYPLRSVLKHREGNEISDEGGKRMKIGMVIYSNDPETVWDTIRLGNSAMNERDEVKVFLLASRVECESLDTEKFKVTEQMETFVKNGGHIFACCTCLKIRQLGGSEICPLYTTKDLYEIVKGTDKVITF
jgi:uncharacterized protein involved in oxidation of intracellular sulfur